MTKGELDLLLARLRSADAAATNAPRGYVQDMHEAATALTEQAAHIEALEVQLAQRDDLLIKAVLFRFADDVFVQSRGPGAWCVTDDTFETSLSKDMVSFAEAVTFAREIAARRDRTTEKKDAE